MDPLSAIGLAANILAFIDFGVKLVSTAKDIYESGNGTKRVDQARETAVTELKQLSSKLQSTFGSQVAEGEQTLCRLAAECQALSERILALLEKIKPKDPTSKLKAVKAAWKSKVHEEEKAELQDALNHCRAQLHLQLHQLDSADSKAKLKALIETSKKDAANFDRISAQLADVQHRLESFHLNTGSNPQQEQLIQIHSTAVRFVIQEKILQALAFDTIIRRYEAVEDAHLETFRWILDDDVQEKDEERIAAKKLFSDWLASGSGIFHISGKLGAGKSTLMKFLCEHERTQELLTNWADKKPLIFSNYFFWKPGDELQKSLLGLIRSLLYAILRAVPELLPDTFPAAWSAFQANWSVTRQAELTARDIHLGFLNLMKQPGKLDNYRFCFFIDGLDEYEGGIQTDTKYMVEQLIEWTKIHIGNIKLCVSSREYNIFMNSFSSQFRLRLHQLTRKDMESYARSRLAHIPNDSDRALATMVTERADGIFLWVAVVIKNIRDQFEDGASFEELVQDLDSLPQELNELFAHILKALSTRNRERAYQTFSLVLCAQNYNVELSLFAYSFLEQFHANKSFAEAEDLDNSEAPDFGTPNSQISKESVQKRLNGSCKGLVELVGSRVPQDIDPGSVPAETHRLAFTHRSVPEFLQGAMTDDHMNAQLRGFIPEEALSQLLHAEMRYKKGPWISFERFSAYVHAIIRMRMERRLDAVPYTFLQMLEGIARKQQIEQDRLLENQTVIIYKQFRNVYICMPVTKVWEITINSPFVISAHDGNLEYVEWRIQHDPILSSSQEGMHLLILCLCWGSQPISEGQLHLIDMLHKKGFSPNQPTPFYPGNFSRMPEVPKASLNPWKHLVLGIISIVFDGYVRVIEEKAGLIEKWALLAEKWLQLGVDKHLYIQHSLFSNTPRLSSTSTISSKVEKQSTSLDYYSSEDESLDDHSSEDVVSEEYITIELIGNDETRVLAENSGGLLLLRLSQFTEQDGRMSLCDLFKYANPPNLVRILELLDKEAPLMQENTTAADVKLDFITEPDPFAIVHTEKENEEPMSSDVSRSDHQTRTSLIQVNAEKSMEEQETKTDLILAHVQNQTDGTTPSLIWIRNNLVFIIGILVSLAAMWFSYSGLG